MGAVVAGFSASVNAFVEPADFDRFELQLKGLYETLHGTAELRPVETQVAVVLAGNGRGGSEATGDISSIDWRV